MDEFMVKTHKNPNSREESKQSEKGGQPRAATMGCGSHHGQPVVVAGGVASLFFKFLLLIASSWTVVFATVCPC